MPDGPVCLCAANNPVKVGSLVGPLELELDLLLVPLSFVFDVELGASGHVDPLPGYLDLEPLARLEGVGQPPQLRHELRGGVDLLYVPLRLFAHQPSLVWFAKISHPSRSAFYQ